MTITVVYPSLRDRVDVAREQDGRRERLVLMVPAGMPPGRILAEARPRLSPTDAAELADALGLEQPDGTP